MVRLPARVRDAVSGIIKWEAALLLILTMPAALILLPGCGKKGPPSMKSYEKPASPSNLVAKNRENRIYLRWSFPKDKEITIERFVLLRSTGDGFSVIAEPAAGDRTYTDAATGAGITPGLQYKYKILTKSPRGVFSADSNTVTLSLGPAPVPPEGIAFKATDTALELNWRVSGSGHLYNVYKTYERGVYSSDPVNLLPLQSASFRDSFQLNRPVYYTVRSLTEGPDPSESAASEEIVVDPSSFVPGPPQDLSYFASESRVFLSWTEPPESWVTGFRVYRKTAGTEFRLVGEPQVPAFIDSDASAVERSYRVHAVGPLQEGPGVELPGVRLEKQQ